MAPKKSQQQKLSLGDFLNDQSLGSWADEMETAPLPATPYQSSRTNTSSGGWGASSRAAAPAGDDAAAGGFRDRTAGYAVREQLPMPDKPPYTAHLGNLSFEVTEADVRDFLDGCEVTSVRIVEDKMDRRPKGFGYVEFGTVDGLKKALTLSETQFQGRNIRISVADPPKDREPQRELNDWTRKGPLPDLPGQRDGGMRRGMGDRAGSFRQGPPEGVDSKPRDFGNWERKGPLTPAEPRPQGERRESNFNREPREPRAAPQWGEGAADRASGSGDRPPRPERPERQPTAADMDDKWRSRMKPDSPAASPDASTPTSPQAPAQRPRLNLAKRTVSEAPANNDAAASSKASPFGAARPIDTSAREQEIEEKRKLAIREKKEADDKAREEKRAKETAAKAEKDEKKEGEDKQYEILRRMDEGDEADKEGVDADAEGTIADDKQVKPQEITREVPAKGGDSWRKTEEPQTTAETMEDDGWSTVSTKTKNFNRRGGNRAMAS
ncbi:RNA-binding domain-containing protein [Aureobasidium pullulans]|nr:RNA-binding domain-containing protein [Aureobasidium pullulans]